MCRAPSRPHRGQTDPSQGWQVVTGPGTGYRQPRLAPAESLRRMGVGERTEQLAVALQWMLEGYRKAAAAMPEGSQSRAILDGAFGPLPGMADEILNPPRKRRNWTGLSEPFAPPSKP